MYQWTPQNQAPRLSAPHLSAPHLWEGITTYSTVQDVLARIQAATPPTFDTVTSILRNNAEALILRLADHRSRLASVVPNVTHHLFVEVTLTQVHSLAVQRVTPATARKNPQPPE